MLETVYFLTYHPSGHRVFSVGMLDRDGRLWQFWGSPAWDTIRIIEGDADTPDLRFPVSSGHDFSIYLRAREIDPALLTLAMVKTWAREWVKGRNRAIKSGIVTH